MPQRRGSADEPDLQKLELGAWVLATDPAATAEAYARIDAGGCETCGCEPCFNFAEARHLVFSTGFVDLLEFLGIDPLLESEVAYRGASACGQHLYSGWFHLVGRIERGPVENVAIPGAFESRHLMSIGEGLRVAFSEDRTLAPEAFADLPVVELELEVIVPWVCAADEPD